MGKLNRYIFEVDSKLFEKENLFKAFDHLREKAEIQADKLNLKKLEEDSAISNTSKDDLRHFSILKEGYSDETLKNCNFCSRYLKFKFADGDATSKKISSDESTYFDRKNNVVIVSYELFEDYEEKDETVIIPTILEYLNEHKFLTRNAGFRMNAKPIALREDDARLLVDIFELKKPVTQPILIVKEETKEIKDFCKKMQGLVTVFLNEDEDILDEVSNMDCKNKEALLELLVSDFACITPSLADRNELCVYSCETFEKTVDKLKHFNNEIFDNQDRNAAYSLFNSIKKEFESYSSLTQSVVDQTNHLRSENDKLKKKVGALLTERSQETTPLYIKKDALNTENVLLLKKTEKELYPYEIMDMVMESLKDYRKNYVKDNTRRADILDDIIKNTATTGIIEKKRKEIDEKMNDFESGTSPKSRRILEDLGFKIKNGSHIKLLWQKDNRYCSTIASTPSDQNVKKVLTREFKEKFL